MTTSLSSCNHGGYVYICLPVYLSSPSKAIYAVYTSPSHPPIPNHLPTLIVTPHGYCSSFLLKSYAHSVEIGQPTNILYSYLHTNYVSLASTLLVIPLKFLEFRKLSFNAIAPRRSLCCKALSSSSKGIGKSFRFGSGSFLFFHLTGSSLRSLS